MILTPGAVWHNIGAVDSQPGTKKKQSRVAELVAVFFLCAAFAYIATFTHAVMIDRHAVGEILSWHRQVLSGEAPSPNQYRPGAYVLAELLSRAFFGNPVAGYHYERMFFTFLTGFFGFMFFRRYLSFGWSLATLAWFFAILPFTYIGYGHQPADPINSTFYVLAYLAMASGAPFWLIPITGLGVYFRETALLIPVYGLMLEYDLPPFWKRLARFIAAIVLGLLVYGTIRWFYGPAEHPDSFIMLGENVNSFIRDGLHNFLLMVFLTLVLLPTVIAFWSWRHIHKDLKRGMLFALVFIVIHFIFGRFGETRLYLPILPLLLLSATYGLKSRFPD